jgi:hypothetical protein
MDRLPGQPKFNELPQRHDTVLALGQFREGGTFVTHTVSKVPASQDSPLACRFGPFPFVSAETERGSHEAYDALKAKAKDAGAELTAFEPLFFGNLVHVLDNLFVHRLRKQEGKQAKEVRTISNAALNGDASTEIDEEGFRRLADEYFTEIEAKFAG